MRHYAQYLYVADLVRGKRVLELPCGDGDGARFLAEQGAERVIGVDSSASAIAEGRRRHRLSNLELRCETMRRIELDDGEIDCVVIADGAKIIRTDSVLEELRRLLAADGRLIVAARSADRAGGSGGVSYHELGERLGSRFGDLHMVGMHTFAGCALVGYGSSAGQPVDGVVLDRTLVRRDPEVSDYLAIAGPCDLPLGTYTVFELPGMKAQSFDTDAVPTAVADDETQPGLFIPVGAPPPVTMDQPSPLATQEMPALFSTSSAPAAAELSDDAEPTAEPTAELAAELAAQEAKVAELEQALAAARNRGEQLEHSLEEAETARAELEAQVAEAEAAAEEMHRALIEVGSPSSTPPAVEAEAEAEVDETVGEPAVVEADGELDGAVHRLHEQLAVTRQILDQILVELSDLADREVEPMLADVDDQVRSMTIELGVRDAELALLNVGLSSVQARLATVVDRVCETHAAMADQPASELRTLMSQLVAELEQVRG